MPDYAPLKTKTPVCPPFTNQITLLPHILSLWISCISPEARQSTVRGCGTFVFTHDADHLGTQLLLQFTSFPKHDG